MGASCSAAIRAMLGSCFSPQISFMMLAPDSMAALATSGLYVSTLIGMSTLLVKPSSAGINLSSSDFAVISMCPGRVDCAPRSNISAPSA